MKLMYKNKKKLNESVPGLSDSDYTLSIQEEIMDKLMLGLPKITLKNKEVVNEIDDSGIVSHYDLVNVHFDFDEAPDKLKQYLIEIFNHEELFEDEYVSMDYYPKSQNLSLFFYYPDDGSIVD